MTLEYACPRGGRRLEGVRKDSEPRCDRELDEDCRQRGDEGEPIIEAGKQLEWIKHHEAIGYCISQTKRSLREVTVTVAVQAEVLDPNTTERVKTSATRSWDEAVEVSERYELG